MPDDDGYSDLTEMMAGTSAVSSSETPPAGLSDLHPALEMVTVLGTGTNYQIQGINSLIGGGWTNIGGVVVGAGQELQHFISIRGKTNMTPICCSTPHSGSFLTIPGPGPGSRRF